MQEVIKDLASFLKAQSIIMWQFLMMQNHLLSTVGFSGGWGLD